MAGNIRIATPPDCSRRRQALRRAKQLDERLVAPNSFSFKTSRSHFRRRIVRLEFVALDFAVER